MALRCRCAKPHLHWAGVALLCLGFIAWIIAMGGLAATTADCKSQSSEDNTVTFTSCAQAYQQDWWGIWFEFFLLVSMLSCAFIDAFDRARLIFLTYLSMVTILLTLTSTKFITEGFKYYTSPDTGATTLKDVKFDGYGATATGTVLLCIINFALIIFTGKDIAYAGGSNAGYGGPGGMDAKYQPSAV